jgi:FkbM family methyltransferase
MRDVVKEVNGLLGVAQKAAGQRVAQEDSMFSPPKVELIPVDFLRDRGYPSQIGQDYLVDRCLFNQQESGTFVDVGAHDGVRFSNTYFLEVERYWRGLCVEPNPRVFRKLQQNRSCAVVQCAVSSHTGTAEFTSLSGYTEMLSGITTNLNDAHRVRIERELAQHGGSSETIEVDVKLLSQLLDECDIRDVDVLSIDTEGSEMQVLQGLDFDAVEISVVMVENNYGESDVTELLVERDYLCAFRLGWDDFFVHRDFLRNWRPPSGG